MLTIQRKLADVRLSYPLEKEVPLDKTLVMDIETTGFSAKNSIVYLIGCAFCADGCWNMTQWFAPAYEDEADIIQAFFQFARQGGYTHLIHFNGNNFDLPFLRQRCAQHILPFDFSTFTGIDLYRRAFPFRDFLHLPDCRQKTLERFLGLKREDPYDGGQLIEIYHELVKKPDDFSRQIILDHNCADLKGIFHILPILSYGDIFSGKLKVKKVQANRFYDSQHNINQELYMRLRFPTSLPKEVSSSKNGCYFTGDGDYGALRVPLYEEEFKYFYSNYMNYYYLPIEDMAVHKSIASFVDRENRVQAKASNCYTRKQGLYLQQWDVLFEPCFKRDYEDPDLFFEVTPALKQDRNAFQIYALHILKMLADIE